MNYTDLVKPATYADEEGLHRLLTTMRQDDPVALIETPTHDPFWAITKHADITEISGADDQFLSAPRVVLQTKQRQAELLERQAQQATRTLVELIGDEHNESPRVYRRRFSLSQAAMADSSCCR